MKSSCGFYGWWAVTKCHFSVLTQLSFPHLRSSLFGAAKGIFGASLTYGDF